MESDIRFDRSASPDFLAHFLKGGVAESLLGFVNHGVFPLDLQMRKSYKTGQQHASLYLGLTAVLNIVESTKTKNLKLTADKFHLGNGRFPTDLVGKSLSAEQWRSRWYDIEMYLERAIPPAVARHATKEGAVQTAVSRAISPDRLMLDREVMPSYRNLAIRTQMVNACKNPILDALNSSDFTGFGQRPKSLGQECDLLAVDTSGRILAIEVKPLGVQSAITWVPAQAAMYARVLQNWINQDSSKVTPRTVLSRMIQQRQKLGDAPGLEFPLPRKLEVTPVVALQRGAKDVYIKRMLQVRDALDAEGGLGLPPIEIYEVSFTGQMNKLK